MRRAALPETGALLFELVNRTICHNDRTICHSTASFDSVRREGAEVDKICFVSYNRSKRYKNHIDNINALNREGPRRERQLVERATFWDGQERTVICRVR